MKKVLTIILTIIAATILVACNNDKLDNIREISFNSMNTTITILTKDEKRTDLEEEEISNAIYKIKTIFDNLDKLTDNFIGYKDINNMFYINNNPDKKILIDEELYNIIELAENYKQITNGYFDISIGLIIDVWKELLLKNNPTQADLDLVIQTVDKIEVINDPIKLEKENDKHYITLKTGAKIDLGAIAKGYGVQKAREILESVNLKYYRVLGSDSSVYYGENNNVSRDYYTIGLIPPKDYEGKLYTVNGIEYNYYTVLRAKNETLTTSGDTIQYTKINDTIVHHIVSPITKRPENFRRSVTIYTDEGALGDALSTAIMSMPYDVYNEWAIDNVYNIIFLNGNNTIESHLNNDKIEWLG